MKKQLTTVKLGGFLGKKYGKTFKLGVRNPVEAVALLAANFKTFRKDFIKYNYRVMVNKDQKDENELFDNAAGKCIHIIPILAGSGNVGKIVVGAVLILLTSGAAAGTVAAAVNGVGWSLVIGGVIGLMFGQNKTEGSDSEDSQKSSYLFGGTLNTTGRGNPVPILYGEGLVGSQVISAGISTEPI